MFSPDRYAVLLILLLAAAPGCGDDTSPTPPQVELPEGCHRPAEELEDCDIVEDSLHIRSVEDIEAICDTRCTRVPGSLRISGLEGVEDLRALPVIRHVNRSFSVKNSGLMSLAGLEEMETVGGLRIEDSAQLRTLDGLQGLRTIAGSATISFNPRLESLQGLNNLEEIGYDALYVQGNESMTSLAGMDSLTHPSASLIFIDLPQVRDLAGLEAVREAKGVTFNGLEELRDVSALDDLEKVDIGLYFDDLPKVALCQIEAIAADMSDTGSEGLVIQGSTGSEADPDACEGI